VKLPLEEHRMAVTYIVTMYTDCEQCYGTGAGNCGPERDECHACGGDGATFDDIPLADALRDLGVLDRLAALESAVRHLEKAK
jgi:hypothetical protein